MIVDIDPIMSSVSCLVIRELDLGVELPYDMRTSLGSHIMTEVKKLRDEIQRLNKRLHERGLDEFNSICPACGEMFMTRHSRKKTCSDKCRQRMHRFRVKEEEKK